VRIIVPSNPNLFNFIALPELAEKANELLIKKYHHNDAIMWRLDRVRESATPFEEQEGAHSVGDYESELHGRKFAAPLMNLKTLGYQDNFINLLEHAFILFDKDKLYQTYVQYIWQIIYAYFDNLKEYENYEPLKKLEGSLRIKSDQEGINWYVIKLRELRLSYMDYIGKPKNIAHCISLYNNFKKTQYATIASPRNLFDEIVDAINNDLQDWIVGEGKKLMQDRERELQKFIKIQLDHILLRKGYQITIIREPQLLDDTRGDFLIYSGFIGPIVMEIKLIDHTDMGGSLTSKPSYEKMNHYMTCYKAPHGIFLVIDNRGKLTTKYQRKKLNKISNVYNNINNVETIAVKSPELKP